MSLLPYNMPMLRRLLQLGCTLIDYEKVTDEHGRRLVFFGRHAGLAGTIETLWALGQRLAWQGFVTPLAQVRHAYEYHNLAEAKAAIAQIGAVTQAEGLPEALAPLMVGVTGYGNVAKGAWEILSLLPIEVIEPAQLADVISCDVEGSVEITVKITEPGQSVFVYDLLTGAVHDGYEGPGVVVMAMDILPSELPRDASESFSAILAPYIPAIAATDISAPSFS